MTNNKKWYTKVIDFFIKHTIIRVILTCIFPLWFSFCNNYLGTFLGLKDLGELTVKGWIVNVILLVVYILFSIIIGLIPKRNEHLTLQKDEQLKVYEDTIAVDEKLIEITSDLCSRKLSKISDNVTSQSVRGIDIFCPIDHLNEISYNIRDCVSSITGIPKKKITISMLYKLKENENWKWVNQSDLVSKARYDAESLVKNPYSTFHYVLESETLVVFNDKLKSSKKHQYVLDDNDNSHKKIGSIACQKILVPVDEEQMTVLLSISTYGYRFVDNDDVSKIKESDVEIFKENLRDKILNQFVKRISLELFTLYMQTYKK